VLHVVKVNPVRLRRYSAHLFVDASFVVAYRAECSCGAKGQARRTVRAARDVVLDHRGEAGGEDGKKLAARQARPTNPSP